MQHYKMQVPAELQDGSEEWPTDLKLKWQQTVLLWNAMLQVSFDREHLATMAVVWACSRVWTSIANATVVQRSPLKMDRYVRMDVTTQALQM